LCKNKKRIKNITKLEIMAKSIKELEKQAQREMYAKEFSKVYKKNNNVNVSTFVKYDGTPKHN
jgi:hypothetical protein